MSKNWNPPVNRGRTELGDEEFEKLHIQTRILRSHPPPLPEGVDPVSGKVPLWDPKEPFLPVPIYQTAVYRNHSVQHYLDILNEKGYIYQRLGNPTTEAAETLINELEQGAGTILFSSGLAAMNATFLAFLKSGDHLIYPKPCYTGTFEFVRNVLEKFGVETDTVQAGAPIEEYRKLIKKNTKMLYAETPCNPNMALTDLIGLAALAKEHPGMLTAVDGTFASPYLQQPLKLGINISIHSCSKYLGGHTDLIGGALTVSDLQLWKHVKVYTAATGALLTPFDSYLLYRGVKTLPLRVDKHCQNAMVVAQFLESHPKVFKVWYPGLPSHPQHDIAKKQMKNFGGMISFELGSSEEAIRFVESLKIINLAVSLGGVESLIEHPASMTHGKMLMSDEERLEGNITDGLIRFSVGLEDERDLIKDLKQALDSC